MTETKSLAGTTWSLVKTGTGSGPASASKIKFKEGGGLECIDPGPPMFGSIWTQHDDAVQFGLSFGGIGPLQEIILANGHLSGDHLVITSQTVFLKLGSSTTTPVMFVYEEDKA